MLRTSSVYVFICLALAGLLLQGCGSGSSSTKKDPPVDPAVIDAKRTKVLNYITDLSNASAFKGTISGQNCYHGNQITDSDSLNGYKKLVEALHTATGKWVGILSLDYEYEHIFTSAQLSQANEVLIDYSKAGGIIAITVSPQNPWVNDESDIVNNPGTWDGPSSPQDKGGIAKVTSLNDLIDPSKAVNIAWMRKLDRIAAALQELRDAGVIVLFRPMQEMNGDWMWWGMKSHPNDPSPYANVFKHMRNYFTNTKKLNNLIWVYSPNASMGADNTSTGNRTVDWAYPGDDAVDIVAGTSYNDNMSIDDYAKYVSLNKPIGMAELGPTL
ncbi:MAG TPA: glycosyl hydrolase, partial [Spirochaetota bacterium]